MLFPCLVPLKNTFSRIIRPLFLVKPFDSLAEWVYHVVVGNWHSRQREESFPAAVWHVFSIWRAYDCPYKLRFHSASRPKPSEYAVLRRKRVTFAGRESIDFRKLVLI